jgi:hypothetical protein
VNYFIGLSAFLRSSIISCTLSYFLPDYLNVFRTLYMNQQYLMHGKKHMPQNITTYLSTVTLPETEFVK